MVLMMKMMMTTQNNDIDWEAYNKAHREWLEQNPNQEFKWYSI